MKEKIIPSLVLTIVCAIVCGLLAVVNLVTKDKIAQAEIDKVQKSLVSVFGEDTYTQIDAQPEGVTAVYTSQSGLTIFDITADGYSKGGIRALIGFHEDGTIANVGIVSCGETAGVGTKIQDNSYLTQYAGAADSTDYPDLISGATFSSTGLRNAVELAAQAFKEVQ
jgi:electron transport complex protein RnfG